MLRIDFGELFPFFGQIIESEDRGYRANRHTSSTIDAFDRVDVQLSFRGKILFVLSWMNTIDGARIDAGRIFCSNAGFDDHVSHENGASYFNLPLASQHAPTRVTGAGH